MLLLVLLDLRSPLQISHGKVLLAMQTPRHPTDQAGLPQRQPSNVDLLHLLDLGLLVSKQQPQVEHRHRLLLSHLKLLVQGGRSTHPQGHLLLNVEVIMQPLRHLLVIGASIVLHK